MPLRKTARYEPVRSKIAPDIQPPSAGTVVIPHEVARRDQGSRPVGAARGPILKVARALDSFPLELAMAEPAEMH